MALPAYTREAIADEITDVPGRDKTQARTKHSKRSVKEMRGEVERMARKAEPLSPLDVVASNENLDRLQQVIDEASAIDSTFSRQALDIIIENINVMVGHKLFWLNEKAEIFRELITLDSKIVKCNAFPLWQDSVTNFSNPPVMLVKAMETAVNASAKENKMPLMILLSKKIDRNGVMCGVMGRQFFDASVYFNGWTFTSIYELLKHYRLY
jgi:hypothetical protein